MKTGRNLSEYLVVEPGFQQVVDDIRGGRYTSPLEIDPKAWAYCGWESLCHEDFFELMLPHIRYQVGRAKKQQSVYKGRLDHINPEEIKTMEDFWRVPILVKDSRVSDEGFRQQANENPHIMIPNDLRQQGIPFELYFTGGTKGKPTPLAITDWDKNTEGYGFARGFRYEGMKPGDVMYSTYNLSHKGGTTIQRAANLARMNFIPRRTDLDATKIAEQLRTYGVNVLLTVQPPISRGDKEGKGGGGVDLLALYGADTDAIASLDILFLGGYRLADEAMELAKELNVQLVTLLGSAEAIPQATNTAFGSEHRLCQGNNLHLLNGPHYMEVLTRESNGRWVPTKRGDVGLLVYTTIGREGTIFIRYAPGDQARIVAEYGECPCGIKSPVITDVARIDDPEDVLTSGCVAS